MHKYYHELTSKIETEILKKEKYEIYDCDYIDSIIRSYLSDVGKEIKEAYGLGWGAQKKGHRYITEILGISQQEPEPISCHDKALTQYCQYCKPKTAEEWPCEHIKAIKEYPYWTFCCKKETCETWVACPWCGAIRPKEKSLAEKLQERMDDHAYCGADLAKIATDHFNSTKPPIVMEQSKKDGK